jgi:hypothetical protein
MPPTLLTFAKPSVINPVVFTAGPGTFTRLASIPLMPAPVVAEVPGPAPTPGTAATTGYCWAGSNFITSHGIVVPTPITDLNPGATELTGRWARIVGKTQLKGDFLQKPFDGELVPLPGSTAMKAIVTRDGFDQVVTYLAITGLMNYLSGLGLNMAQVIRTRMPVIAAPNAVDDLNAWMDPGRSNGIDLTGGTAKNSRGGEWHLFSDMEVVWHELGHLIFHCVNSALTSWYAGDGGAIHEGFGDGTACLYTRDPEASEDFPLAMGGDYGTARGLRTVDNKLKYGEVDPEVHSLGRVYGAFWWAVMKSLSPLLGNDEKSAADLALLFLNQHGFHYATNRPGPKDFLDATIVGARTYLEGSDRFRGLEFAKVEAILKAAADERGMLVGETRNLSERLTTLDELTPLFTHLANRFAFILASSAMGTFGGRDTLQQYALVDGAPVRMLGSGLIYFRNLGGDVVSYSRGDVRTNLTVSPEIKVEPVQALQAVIAEAQRLAEERRRKEEELKRQGRGETHEAWLTQMSRQRFEEAAAEAQGDTVRLQVEFVVMPEDYKGSPPEHLHYQFTLAGTHKFYVDAVTGQVAAMQIPQW